MEHNVFAGRQNIEPDILNEGQMFRFPRITVAMHSNHNFGHWPATFLLLRPALRLGSYACSISLRVKTRGTARAFSDQVLHPTLVCRAR